jgi:hypothetical protein
MYFINIGVLNQYSTQLEKLADENNLPESCMQRYVSMLLRIKRGAAKLCLHKNVVQPDTNKRRLRTQQPFCKYWTCLMAGFDNTK